LNSSGTCVGVYDQAMDALGALLEGPRARGAFLLRAMMDPPWSMRIEDEAPVAVVAMVSGTAWIVPDGEPAMCLKPGDVAVCRGPEHYTVAHDPDQRPDIRILPGERCVTAAGVELVDTMNLGVRTWGNSADGGTVMLVGTYQLDGDVSQRLLNVLPPRVVLAADEWDCPLIPVLAGEITKDDPGQDVVLDRLLDLLLIAVLRTWFSRPEAGAPGWYRAQGDPIVGRAIRMLHHNPAHPWTVAGLARETGVSRAAFARRFSDLVGEPPMAFLTNWRLALAADLLREPSATVGAVARQVGYGSSFALSTAFKRVRGVSPQGFREALLA
jgi:AraC-like DNA-binding protein